jgi:dTDP-4-amino-4,6-dideoxygalactose transaminase
MLEGNKKINIVRMAPECVPSRHLYQVLVNQRDEVMLALNQANIFPGVHYRDNTLYKMYAYAQGTCPRSHAASEQIISLPLHMRLTYPQVKYIAEKLIEIVARLEPAK